MQAQPLIAVQDVEATSAWYQAILGLESGHGGRDYEQLLSGGRMVLQLHSWGAHDHRPLGDPNRPPFGNGILLWFRTEHFDALVGRATAAATRILEGPIFNPNACHRELWLADPDGYVVVVAGD